MISGEWGWTRNYKLSATTITWANSFGTALFVCEIMVISIPHITFDSLFCVNSCPLKNYLTCWLMKTHVCEWTNTVIEGFKVNHIKNDKTVDRKKFLTSKNHYEITSVEKGLLLWETVTGTRSINIIPRQYGLVTSSSKLQLYDVNWYNQINDRVLLI